MFAVVFGREPGVYIDCPGRSQELQGGYPCSQGDQACGAPGADSGLTDEDYQAEGARIVDAPENICGEAGLVCKVKEPLPEAFGLRCEPHAPG